MPYAFVNGLLRVARAADSGDGDGQVSPYVLAVRDALRVGGCTASRAGLVGACVAAASVSLGWSQVEGSTLGGVPLAWVERVWCGQRVLELQPELGGRDRLQTPLLAGLGSHTNGAVFRASPCRDQRSGAVQRPAVRPGRGLWVWARGGHGNDGGGSRARIGLMRGTAADPSQTSLAACTCVYHHPKRETTFCILQALSPAHTHSPLCALRPPRLCQQEGSAPPSQLSGAWLAAGRAVVEDELVRACEQPAAHQPCHVNVSAPR